MRLCAGVSTITSWSPTPVRNVWNPSTRRRTSPSGVSAANRFATDRTSQPPPGAASRSVSAGVLTSLPGQKGHSAARSGSTGLAPTFVNSSGRLARSVAKITQSPVIGFDRISGIVGLPAGGGAPPCSMARLCVFRIPPRPHLCTVPGEPGSGAHPGRARTP